MDKEKNLLIKAMEECGKITQYCSKAIKFGLFSHHPNEHVTNGDKILTKYYHLQAIIEELQHNRVLPTYSKSYIDAIKRETIHQTKTLNKKHKEGNNKNEKDVRRNIRKR